MTKKYVIHTSDVPKTRYDSTCYHTTNRKSEFRNIEEEKILFTGPRNVRGMIVLGPGLNRFVYLKNTVDCPFIIITALLSIFFSPPLSLSLLNFVAFIQLCILLRRSNVKFVFAISSVMRLAIYHFVFVFFFFLNLTKRASKKSCWEAQKLPYFFRC